MQIAEFATLVLNMRFAQKKYFETRDGNWLLKAKALEKRVDGACEELLTPGLFDAEEKRGS